MQASHCPYEVLVRPPVIMDLVSFEVVLNAFQNFCLPDKFIFIGSMRSHASGSLVMKIKAKAKL